jgi:hypothetical protein
MFGSSKKTKADGKGVRMDRDPHSESWYTLPQFGDAFTFERLDHQD